MTTHEQERQVILKEYPLTYFIAAAALFIVLGIAIGTLLFGQNSPLADADNSYFSNVYLTIISTAFTVIVIDRLNRRRDEQRDLRQLQEQLVRDVRSTSNEIAKNAVHQMWDRGWLHGEGGLLKGEQLKRANLSDALLFGANLQGTDLAFANLRNANLSYANLQRAELEVANLQGVDLGGANLRDAILGLTELDENSILPDYTKWTPDTDMTRFIDPNHPNFWRSDDTQSPAYRGSGAAPTVTPLPKP